MVGYEAGSFLCQRAEVRYVPFLLERAEPDFVVGNCDGDAFSPERAFPMSTPKAGDRHLLDRILGVEPPPPTEDTTLVRASRGVPGNPIDPTPPPVTDATPASVADLPLTEPADVTSGALIDGRYRVLGLLGRGGIGLVYLCRHEVLEKPVAMKVLRPEYADQPEVVQRFVNEARAASAFKSPRIVDTLDVGTLPSGAPYFVMEHVEAETLAAVLQRDGFVAMPEALEIARQIAEGLEAAHAAGVVHRDLKPENVFVGRTPEGRLAVKIFDFGVAKVTRAKNRLTHVGAVFGTPSYMSPEQARGQSVDQRADIYALGIMLYEMLAGELPFQGDDPLSVMAQHVERPVPRLTVTPAGVAVPPALEAIVHRCLAKDANDRYPTVAAFIADLDRFRSGAVPIAASQPIAPPQPEARAPLAAGGPNTASATTTPPARRKSRGRVWALLAVLSGLVALAWFWIPRAAVEQVLRDAGLAPASAAVAAAPPPTASAARASVVPPKEHEVHLVLSPHDAHVYLGDKHLGQMPVSVKVQEGKPLTVTVRRKGYRTRKVVLDGSQKRVVVGLSKGASSSK
ncbi:MAG: protein kinase [Pseudomonadota bacterium]